MKLSLCLATFNEEAFIHYSLDSAYDLVDQVIIVDGGSTDKTVQIARSFGKKVKIIHTDNPPMFHINKQKAIEAAEGEWILQLDADEQLSDKLKEEIKSVIAAPKQAAYWLPRKNFFLTRFLEKGGQYPDYTIRLYKNGVAHFPCKRVHEQVAVEEEVGYLENPLLHYADSDFSRYLARWNRYTSMDANLLFKDRHRLSFVSYFFLKPPVMFFKMYIRHKGFMDGFPGFVFCLFSSIRFWAIYIKVYQLENQREVKIK